MSSVGIANKILDLQNQKSIETRQQQNKKNGMLREPKNRSEYKMKQPQPTLYHGFDGIKENPLFTESVTQQPRKKEDNFSYYRQNENINTVKLKKDKHYDANKLVNGEKTAPSDVINEFRQMYSGIETNNNMVPKNGLKPQQQQKYFSKLSPRNDKSAFSFNSVDFKDPAIIKQEEPKNEEEDFQRNKDFNVGELLKDYRNKKTHKGTTENPKPQTTTKLSDKQSLTEIRKERLRNEELNAKMSGFVQLPPKKSEEDNLPTYNIYQSLNNIPNEVQQYNNQQQKPNGNNKITKPPQEEEWNAWNEFRPKRNKKEKATYIRKDSDDFHFGVMMNDEPTQISNKGYKLKGNNTQTEETNSEGRKKIDELLRNEDEKPTFSVDEVLNDYKSKHIYKEEEKKPQEKHEAIVMKERLKEMNQLNQEKERQRQEKMRKQIADFQTNGDEKRNIPRQPVINVETLNEPAVKSTVDFVNSKENGQYERSINSMELPISNISDIKNRSYRDNEGWTRATPLEKVNPGPTTQAVDYFIRSPKESISIERSPIKINNEEKEVHNNKSADVLSRSNPNVTFGHKNGKEIAEEFRTEFTRNDMAERGLHISQYNNSPSRITKSSIKSKSEPNLFEAERTSELRTTDLNKLNFSSMSSNLRRSGLSQSTDVYSSSRKANGIVYAGKSDNYYLVDNTRRDNGRGTSNRSRSTLGSRQGSIASFGSSTISQPLEKNRSTVMLDKNWSGRFISTGKETQQRYDYGIDIPQQENVSAVVFRNSIPIEGVKPTDKDAISSLNSLDRRLKNENKNEQLIDPVKWIGYSTYDDPQRVETEFYRESKFPKSEVNSLNEKIKVSGVKEGQSMRVDFYEYLNKITAVINEIIKSLPKEHFPFRISPCSFQGDFEKKGLHKIDLYLKIEDLKDFEYQVNFLMKREIAGYVILRSANREQLKSFCAKNRDSGDWVLSANRLMVVFAYLINTKLRSQFEFDSPTRKKKIPFDGQIKFDVISEHQVRLNISFPNTDIVFNVGLLPALDVADFPNVIDLNKKRTWPDSSVKMDFIKHGVHLVAKSGVRNHGWSVSFLKTRKVLLNICDQQQTATNILLALQVINKSALSNRDCDDLLLPAHFIMVLFWLHEKHRDNLEWSKDNMGNRFIDVVIALKRCTEERLCPDFFFPYINYFKELTDEKRLHLLQNIDDVLNTPEIFLDPPSTYKVSNAN